MLNAGRNSRSGNKNNYANPKLIKQFTWVNTVTVDKAIASRCVILHRG